MQPGTGMPFLENIGIDARKRELLEARFIPGDKVCISRRVIVQTLLTIMLLIDHTVMTLVKT